MADRVVLHRLARDGKSVPATGDFVRVARGAGEGQQSVALTTSSAATSTAIGTDSVLVYSTVECFALAATTPTATVANGTPIPALQHIRLSGLDLTDKLAFITATGTGTIYVRPGV